MINNIYIRIYIPLHNVYIYAQVPVFGDYHINLSMTIVSVNFVESAVKKINVPGHTVASLTIWDIPGREDMDLHKTYFRDLDAAIGNYMYKLLLVDLFSNCYGCYTEGS